MKIIVLSTSKYKEKDSIVNAISKEGPVSFRARGSLEAKSALMWINNILTVADVDLLETKYKYPVLNGATLVSSSITGSDSLDYLCTLSALAEITKETLDDQEKGRAFEDLYQAISALKTSKDHLMVTLLYLARCIKLAGVEPNVDGCVYSGKRNDIVAFSFEDGGFISREYMTPETVVDLSPIQLKLVRYCFKAPDFSCVQCEQFSKSDKTKVLGKFIEFIDELLGVRLTATDYLKNN